MQSIYKTEQLIEQGVDFSNIYAEKQEVVKDMTGFDFNLSNIVKFLQKETKEFTQQLPLALDIDRSIFSIYEKWKQSKGEEAEAKPQPKSEEPKEEPKKENSAQIEEWKEVVETYLEFIALGSTEENIAEWTEAVETYRMFIESEESKMAKGGSIGVFDAKLLKQRDSINLTFDKNIELPIYRFVSAEDIQNEDEDDLMNLPTDKSTLYSDAIVYSDYSTRKFVKGKEYVFNLEEILDNEYIFVIDSDYSKHYVIVPKNIITIKWDEVSKRIDRTANNIKKRKAQLKEGVFKFQVGSYDNYNRFSYNKYSKGGSVGYKKTKNGVAYQIIQLDSPMGKYRYVIKGMKFGGFNASYVTDDVLSETQIERIAERNKYATGGGVGDNFDPFNLPVTYRLINDKGEVILKTNSFNKAVDTRTLKGFEGKGKLKIVATDKSGNQKVIGIGVNENGKEYAKGGGVGEIDMDNVQKQAEYYTDEKAWSIKPTIEKFESEIREYENLRYKLDNNLIKPSKIIGSGIKPNLVRPLAYKWLNERILVCKKAIEILKKREGKYAQGGGVKEDFRGTLSTDALPYLLKDTPYRYQIEGEDVYGTLKEIEFAKKFLKDNYNIDSTIRDKNKVGFKKLEVLGQIIDYAKGGGVEKVGKVMHEFKEGTLHSGKSGKIVKDPRQAIAIALSEAKLSKKQ